MLDIAFRDDKEQVTIYPKSQGQYIDGEWIVPSTPPDTAGIEDSMCPIPVTPAQLKYLPEGKYTAGDMKFYAESAILYTRGSAIDYEGTRYIIQDILNRHKFGGFVIYFCRREYGQQ